MTVLLLGAGKGGAGAALAPITITSSATFSAAENQTAVATLTATGGLGSFTWTKIGGADTAKFTLTRGGVLTFTSAPDYETPTDANTDNVYLVQVQAADGVSTPATQNISVTVTDVGEVWLPTVLTTLKGWYRGDALTGADGSAVTSWLDESGIGNHAAPTNGPTLQTAEQNGLNVVQFNFSISQAFTLPNLLSGSSAAAAIAVVKSTAAGAGAPLQIGPGTSPNNVSHYPFSDGNIYDCFGTDVRKQIVAPAGLSSWHLASWHSASGIWKYFKDGTQVFTTATNTVAFVSSPKIGLGGGSVYFNGMIGEIVIVSEFLSGADRQKCEGYLAHKWFGAGAANPLDSGHPYKSAPP